MSEKSGELLQRVTSAEVLTASTPEQARDELQAAVDALIEGRPRLWALEAGAGKRTRLLLPEDAYVVGVDRDATALARNDRLDERIVTDLATYIPRAAGFDLVTCWYVLEHVDDPATLVERFATWTAAEGLIVLAVPNLRSPKALLTKLTPHRFHVWFRRRVLGFPNAGQPGFGPYQTTLRLAISPGALRRRLAARGYRPVFQMYFEDAKQATFRRRLRVTRGRWQVVQAAVRLLSLGWLDAARTEYVAVFRRD